MRFIDEVSIQVASGDGGKGCVAFRREKFIPKGGPSGGAGGNGGSIIIKADENLNTLLHIRGKRFFQAQHGRPGEGWHCNGKSGEDLILKVPVGTMIKSKETQDVLFDFTEDSQECLIAEGGRGGLGNMCFKSSTNQAPRYAQSGLPGMELDLNLELKLLADIALIGLPNAGKSTLISSISAAKPKIADYPFTTLEPQLGVIDVDGQGLVVADIPGLIEDASDGKGLGTKFLKHIERTSAFVHLIDVSLCADEYEAYENYITIREELRKYNEELLLKKEIIGLTKIDAMTSEEIHKFQSFFEEQLDKKVIPLSSISGKNIDLLKRIMLKTKEVQNVQ